MAETPSTFSESWFRIAQQRVALRPHVRVHRQYFRGERWHVLEDPFNNQFFRLRPAAYQFVARLSLDRTLDSVWTECFEEDSENAPGQEEALRLLAQLYGANLLHSSLAPDSARLFERYSKRRSKERKAFFRSIMFARIPLIDPDAFLKRFLPAARLLISWFGLAVWLVVVVAALKAVVDHFPALKQQTQGVLAPDNLVWLYLGLVIIKTVHEFGHAFACRRFGGEVHTMGIMFLLFTPIPYMDATASWGFRNRWQRMFVAAAGMIVEIFVAALATFVWAATGPGVVNSLAYNMMLVASVSTVLFNANPLLRFDGYYILSDLLDIPNLHQRSAGTIRHLIEYHVFGYRKSTSPARSRTEAVWLVVFAIASSIYKVIIFASILFFLADRFLILGVIMVVICAIAWVCVPIYKLVAYLATSPRLERTRPRAVGAVLALIAVLVMLLQVIPFPNRFRAPGVLQADTYSIVVTESAGAIEEVLAPDGSLVVAGQPLFRMVSPELDLQIAAARAQIAETEAMQLRALREATADLQPLANRLEATQKVLARLLAARAALLVCAPHDGLWVAPELTDLKGVWLGRGNTIGQLVDQRSFHFSAIVAQNEASRLFSEEIRGSAVKFHGQAAETVTVTSQRVIPADRRNLPSAAIGWAGGGDVAVDLSERSGTLATEPFFELRAAVAAPPGIELLHGRGGRIRFILPPEPLLTQWVRKFRQLLQKRYGI